MNKHIILVTGAAGYIGSITCDSLLAQGYQIIAIDNLSKGHLGAIRYLENKYGKKSFTWVQKDITTDDLSSLFKESHIDAIVHFAALLNAGESWQIPEKYVTNNVCGTQRLANAALAAGVQKLVFSSSCTVYGNAQYTPIDELHPISDPVTPYGLTKALCEKILYLYSHTKSLQVAFLRYFNVCGATDNGEMGDSKDPSFHLVQNCVRGALGIAPFELNYAKVPTPDGSPIRDYVNVVDLAYAHIKALEYLLAGGTTDAFNIGTGSGNSVLEIVEVVKKLTKSDFSVGKSTNPRKDEADKMIADITKSHKILGWKPERDLAQSVASLILWYTKHPRGWSNTT